MWWLILIYIVVVALVILCSVSISSLLDQLDKRTRISSVFLGGVVLAIITSLPDLFTALSSICFVQNPELAFGGVLGGNFVNIAILGMAMCICTRLYSQTQINKRFLIATIVSLIISIMLLIYAVSSTSLVIPAINVNGLSLIIIALYTFMLFLNRGEKKEITATAIPVSKYSVKQLMLFFAISAIALIALSIGLSYISNVLADYYMIDSTLAGALFIGLATTLPEIVTTIVFIRKKNFNLIVSSITGTVAFNWVILVLCDIFYFNGTVYLQNESAQVLLSFLTVMLSVLAISLATKCFRKKDDLRWLYFCFGVSLVALALAYLVIAFFIV